MDQQNKPVIPTLKDSQKPQVKIKGLQAGLSLFDRLKQFKKKDLAFITAGLGVLFMAPLAEHFMMSPDNGESGQISAGFGSRGGSGIGSGGSVYEGGIHGLAPGGVTGGSDVITPLNVRDPSSLVMGPGSSQQAPATATAPAPVAPSKSESGDWKDALSQAASQGAQAATKKAALPVPHPAMANTGLRGLGSLSGGGGGSYSLPAISAGNVPNRAAGGDSPRPLAANGYKGTAGTRGSQNASAGSMENLKKAAAGAGSDFNRSGSASQGLETAASQSMAGGGSDGGGGPGAGGADKPGSASGSKDSSSTGESLEFLRQKAEQDKAIDLKWDLEKQRQKRWPNLVDKMTEEMIMTPLKGMTGGMTKMFGDWGGDKTKGAKWVCGGTTLPAGSVKQGCPPDPADKDDKGPKYCMPSPGVIKTYSGGLDQKNDLTGCVYSGKDAPGSDKTETPVGGISDGAGSTIPGATMSLADICKSLDDAAKVKDYATLRESMKTAAQTLVLSRDAMSGKPTTDCGVTGSYLTDSSVNIDSSLRKAAEKINGKNGQAVAQFGAIPEMNTALRAASKADLLKIELAGEKTVADSTKAGEAEKAYTGKDVAGMLKAAGEALGVAETAIARVETELPKVKGTQLPGWAMVSNLPDLSPIAKDHYKSLVAYADTYTTKASERRNWKGTLTTALGAPGDGKGVYQKHTDIGKVLANVKTVIDGDVKDIKAYSENPKWSTDNITVKRYVEQLKAEADVEKKKKLDETEKPKAQASLDYVDGQSGYDEKAPKGLSSEVSTLKQSVDTVYKTIPAGQP